MKPGKYLAWCWLSAFLFVGLYNQVWRLAEIPNELHPLVFRFPLLFILGAPLLLLLTAGLAARDRIIRWDAWSYLAMPGFLVLLLAWKSIGDWRVLFIFSFFVVMILKTGFLLYALHLRGLDKRRLEAGGFAMIAGYFLLNLQPLTAAVGGAFRGGIDLARIVMVAGTAVWVFAVFLAGRRSDSCVGQQTAWAALILCMIALMPAVSWNICVACVLIAVLLGFAYLYKSDSWLNRNFIIGSGLVVVSLIRIALDCPKTLLHPAKWPHYAFESFLDVNSGLFWYIPILLGVLFAGMAKQKRASFWAIFIFSMLVGGASPGMGILVVGTWTAMTGRPVFPADDSWRGCVIGAFAGWSAFSLAHFAFAMLGSETAAAPASFIGAMLGGQRAVPAILFPAAGDPLGWIPPIVLPLALLLPAWIHYRASGETRNGFPDSVFHAGTLVVLAFIACGVWFFPKITYSAAVGSVSAGNPEIVLNLKDVKRSSGLVLKSMLTNSTTMPDNAPIATITIAFADGSSCANPVLVGRDTAEWAYSRRIDGIRHSAPPTASSWWAGNGRARFRGRAFEARFNFPPDAAASEPTQIRIQWNPPPTAPSELSLVIRSLLLVDFE